MLRERKTHAEIRELSVLKPVSLIIRKGKLKWCGHVEHKVDANWVKSCVMMEVDGTRQMIIQAGLAWIVVGGEG